MSATLKFETSDKQVIECAKEDIIPYAKIIETLLNEEKISADAPHVLEKVTAENLKKVLAYIVQLKAEKAKKPAADDKKEENNENDEEIKVEDWELEFVKGKTTEEMRKDWDIENDFTPEEEEALIQETKWMED